MLQAPKSKVGTPSSPAVINQDENLIYKCKLCTFCVPLLTQYAEAHVNEHEHCTCLCSRNEELNREMDSLSNATIEVDDNDFEDGREQVENDVISDDVIATLPSPMFDDTTLKTILDMQEKDQDLIECRRFLEGAPLPNKNEAILLPTFIQDFLQNFTSFRLSPQKVITRIFGLSPTVRLAISLSLATMHSWIFYVPHMNSILTTKMTHLLIWAYKKHGKFWEKTSMFSECIKR